MKLACPLASIILGAVVICHAANGPSLDYLEKNVNKVDYGDVVMEVGPPNKKEVLPDGSIIAMWSYDITQIDTPPGLIGGYIVRGEQYKMLRFDSKGVLRSYKWKAGIIGGTLKRITRATMGHPEKLKIKRRAKVGHLIRVENYSPKNNKD